MPAALAKRTTLACSVARRLFPTHLMCAQHRPLRRLGHCQTTIYREWPAIAVRFMGCFRHAGRNSCGLDWRPVCRDGRRVRRTRMPPGRDRGAVPWLGWNCRGRWDHGPFGPYHPRRDSRTRGRGFAFCESPTLTGHRPPGKKGPMTTVGWNLGSLDRAGTPGSSNLAAALNLQEHAHFGGRMAPSRFSRQPHQGSRTCRSPQPPQHVSG